jgi:hypothetical protein
MKISDNFILQEFVPKSIYSKFKNSAAWFVQKRLVYAAQCIRNRFKKPMIINNWHTREHGGYQFRGFRDPLCTVGAEMSQHRFGRAFDFHIKGLSHEEIFQDIIDNELQYMSYGITTVENIEHTNGWIHVDIRWTDKNEILIVSP